MPEELVIAPPAILPPLFAYLGPGIGVGLIAIVLGFIASILLAIFAVVWYPLKRLFGRWKKKRGSETVDEP